MTLIVFTYGYSTFVGGFSIADFFSYYSKSLLLYLIHTMSDQTHVLTFLSHCSNGRRLPDPLRLLEGTQEDQLRQG